MLPIVQNANGYLNEIVGLRPNIHAMPQGNAPVFIADLYDLTKLQIGQHKFLGIVIQNPERFKPSDFEKHQKYFPQVGQGKEYRGYVIIAPYLDGFIRRRLIELKIPFIIPGQQLYWPDLGLEFREHVRNKAAHQPVEKVDPATQAVVIGALNRLYPEAVTPKALATKFHYTPMTMTRAFDEIEALGIGSIHKAGKLRQLTFPETRTLWEKAKPRLINPVRATYRFWEKDFKGEAKLLAGEYALAEMTDLVPPRTPIYAIGRDAWKKIQARNLPQIPIDEPGTCAVQVWRYNPALFANDKRVDVFSLYLSMENEKDERVEMALNEALEAKL